MKKTHLLLAGLLLPVLLGAQPVKFTVEAQISPKATLVYLAFTTARAKLVPFKSDVVDGKFTISGELPCPLPGFIVVRYDSMPSMPTMNIIPQMRDDSDVFYLMAGEEHIKVTTSGRIKDATVTGSPLTVAYRAYLDKMNSFKPDYNRNYSVFIPFLQDFIAKNECPYVTLEAMDAIFSTGRGWDAVAVLETYNKLPAEVRDSPRGALVGERLVRETAVTVGTIAPDLEMPNPEGKMVKLSDSRGKYIILDFWYSGCVPCRHEHPLYAKLYAKYKNKGLEIISVSSDTEKERWLTAIENDKMTWINICDLQPYGKSAAEVYKVIHSPENYLLGPDGKVLAKGLFGDKLESKIDEIFKNK